MFKKTKILVMVLCLGLIPFSVSKAMQSERTREKTISEKDERTLTSEKINFFLQQISKEQKEFKKQWELIIKNSLKKDKEKISKFYIDVLAYLYVEYNLAIQYLDSEGKLNFNKLINLLIYYGKIKPGIEGIELDPSTIVESIKLVKKEISFYVCEMQKQVQFFCNKYKKYASQLNEKIDRYTRMLELSDYDMEVFRKEWCEEAYRDRIYEYIEYLQKSYEMFKRTWNSWAKEFRGKKEISSKTLEKFSAIYQLVMSKIFLDKNGNVKLDEFLKKLAKQDCVEYDIEKISSGLMSEENRNIIKDAFVEYKKLVEKKVEQFCKEHVEYKEALEKKLDEKMSFKDEIENLTRNDSCFLDSIEIGIADENSINVDFEENFSDIMFGKKINEYVESLSEDFTKFKIKWEELLNEHRFEKNLSNEALEKFAAIYRLAMSKIFLDEKGNVKVDEFLKRLEKQNGVEYKNKLTEEQKGILKDAFVEYKKLVEGKLEQFYKVYFKESKEKLDKKINKKTIIFDELIDVLDYLSKNSFPKENYTHLDSTGRYID